MCCCKSCNREASKSGPKSKDPPDCTTPECEQAKKCDTAVTIGRVLRGNPYVPKNANPADGMPDSVPPTKSYEVEVKLTPSLEACPGQYIELSIIDTSADNGTATVSPVKITKTTIVTVTGGDQTKPSHAGNLKIQAKLDGVTVKAESAGFSVCAHPINLRNALDSDFNEPSGVGMLVTVGWDSDSGTFSDLSQAKFSEVVAEVRFDSPPFLPLGAATVNNSGYLAADSTGLVDKHAEPRPSAGPAGLGELHQLFKFKCEICGVTDKSQPNSGLQILHEVYQVASQWKHKARKIGAAVTIGANTVQAGTANVTSSIHDLP